MIPETATYACDNWEFEGALYTSKNGHPEPLRIEYKQQFRAITSGRRLRATLRAGQYTFPGGYQLAFITSDGGALCFDCVRSELWNVLHSIRTECDDGWRVVHCDIIDDYESEVFCDHCMRQLCNYKLETLEG